MFPIVSMLILRIVQRVETFARHIYVYNCTVYVLIYSSFSALISYCQHAEQILPKLLVQHKTLIIRVYSLACSLLLDV